MRMIKFLTGVVVTYLLTACTVWLCCYLLGYGFTWQISTAVWLMITLVMWWAGFRRK